MGIRVSIDTGGTFTDIVACETSSGRLLFHKVHTTPDDPSRALVQGMCEALARMGCGTEELELLVHGTTVATNAVLQRAGARTAFITTAGFRDVLHIQRQSRPKLYDMRARRPEPLVPRELRLELNERTRYDGSVARPIDRAELDALIERLRREQVQAVGVGFLHSYANPAHELEVGRALRENLPGVSVCLSHELSQEHGEYERFSTCVMNAFVQPAMERYLGKLDTALEKQGVVAPLLVMKSNGSVTPADQAARHCVQTILSGPAGGVVSGAVIARHHSQPNLITADMGGTSFDVAVIDQGRIGFVREAQIGGLAIQTPMVDLHTVGAGGGSVGWIDAGGSLRVGPHSAGAVPGPACYGLGNTEPTVTDANLVLGRVAAQSRLGGGMTLDVEAARRAIDDKLARPLRMTIEEAAEGMVRVVNATMVAAIRKLTVERGLDPRTFALCPFGGAGPLHGAELAHEMGMRETLVPLAPGVTSALGLLMSNLREDRLRTHVALLDAVEEAVLLKLFNDLEAQARHPLLDAGHAHGALSVTRRLGLRYHGQGYDLPVEVASASVDRVTVRQAFHAAHKQLYGYALADEPVEMVNAWVSVQAEVGAVSLPEVEPAREEPQPLSRRAVIYAGEAIETPIYDRDSLGAGTLLEGPAIIEQVDTTTVIWPRQAVRVDRFGQLLLGPIGSERSSRASVMSVVADS